MAVTHDNVEACYRERLKGISQVKSALEKEHVVATEQGPMLLPKPPAHMIPKTVYADPRMEAMQYPGTSEGAMAGNDRGNLLSMGPHPGYYGYTEPPPPANPAQLGAFAEHLYDDIETDLKGPKENMGSTNTSFGWMAQDVNPAAPLSHMDDDQRMIESLRRERLANRNAQEAFDRFERGSVHAAMARNAGVDMPRDMVSQEPESYRPKEAFMGPPPGMLAPGLHGMPGFQPPPGWGSAPNTAPAPPAPPVAWGSVPAPGSQQMPNSAPGPIPGVASVAQRLNANRTREPIDIFNADF